MLKMDVIGNQDGINIARGGFQLQLHAYQEDPVSRYNEVLNEDIAILQI
jgi:hypothetical protein